MPSSKSRPTAPRRSASRVAADTGRAGRVPAARRVLAGFESDLRPGHWVPLQVSPHPTAVAARAILRHGERPGLAAKAGEAPQWPPKCSPADDDPKTHARCRLPRPRGPSAGLRVQHSARRRRGWPNRAWAFRRQPSARTLNCPLRLAGHSEVPVPPCAWGASLGVPSGTSVPTMRIFVLHQQPSTRERARRRNRRLRAGHLNGRSNVARPPPVSVIAPASFALVAERRWLRPGARWSGLRDRVGFPLAERNCYRCDGWRLGGHRVSAAARHGATTRS